MIGDGLRAVPFHLAKHAAKFCKDGQFMKPEQSPDRPFVVSYAAGWRLPPPLPPRPLPLMRLAVVILLIVLGLLFAEVGG
jgi:hypothetical protein